MDVHLFVFFEPMIERAPRERDQVPEYLEWRLGMSVRRTGHDVRTDADVVEVGVTTTRRSAGLSGRVQQIGADVVHRKVVGGIAGLFPDEPNACRVDDR